ncbi:MAG TPA: hypothetical protein VEW28_03630, partial [Candidatus Kapabacteria bacterium]|nr:hypothetical protein [Candidatus Kapabacteria bacterium]
LSGNANFVNTYSNDSLYINQRTYEFGLGTFGIVWERTPWEIYLSFMNAKSNIAGAQNTMSGTDVNVTRIWSDYWRLALQGNLMTNGVSMNERNIIRSFYLDHALGVRLSYVNFFNYHEVKHNDYGKSVVIDDVPPKLLSLEISSILKFGAYPLFLEVQYGVALPLFTNKGKFDYINPSIFSLGASLCFY